MSFEMKMPLGYQTTEYDCGPTTLVNAFRYLFSREEIPPEIIKNIMMYSLDCYDDKGECGKNGTSTMAMLFLSSWLNQYAHTKNFPVNCEFLNKDEVKITQNSKIITALQQGGAVVVRLMFGVWHYVLLTGVKVDKVKLFDPYYRVREFREKDIKIIGNTPRSANRLVSFDRLNGAGAGYYELGPFESREAVILFNSNSRITPEKSIEYFI